jgi:hypothetical protein
VGSTVFEISTQAREADIKQQHEQYLEDHPEVKGLLGDFISAALVEQPLDVFEFAREHFKGTATEVVEKAEPAADDDDMGEAGDQDDDDDLDDMVAASGGSSELTAYLKKVFESMDTDSSGSISRTELNAKLTVRRAPSPRPARLSPPRLAAPPLPRLCPDANLSWSFTVTLHRRTRSCRSFSMRRAATVAGSSSSSLTSMVTVRSHGWNSSRCSVTGDDRASCACVTVERVCFRAIEPPRASGRRVWLSLFVSIAARWAACLGAQTATAQAPSMLGRVLSRASRSVCPFLCAA